MKYSKTIRFQYYQLKYCKHDGKKLGKSKVFNLVNWIDKMHSENRIKKKIEFGKLLVRIDEIKYDIANIDKNKIYNVIANGTLPKPNHDTKKVSASASISTSGKKTSIFDDKLNPINIAITISIIANVIAITPNAKIIG